MDPANITRDEARRRSLLLQTSDYDVLVDLTGRFPDGSPLPDPERTFISRSIITFTSGAGETHLDLIAERILSASLDGVMLDPAGFTGQRLPLVLAEGAHTLTVAAVFRYSRTGEGLHRFVDPLDGVPYLYTQLETADARRVYACFEQPDLKARFTFTALAPLQWTVLSNSPSVTPTPLDETFGRWTFAPTPPISTYITALAAGGFHSETRPYEGQGGPLTLGLHCRQSLVGYLDADRLFAVTAAGFEIFEKHFGTPYAFGDYDQVFVPEFNAGAMENAGMVTIRDEYLPRSRMTEAMYDTRDSTILHELAHMWFGDLVTMRWWDDLWLNESFAEWASYFAQAEERRTGGGINPWATFAGSRKNWAYRQDQLPSTHPIAADMVDLEAVENNFDGITYAKGASALQQLVAWVGQDAFLAGVRAYFAEFAYHNTELGDLLRHLAEASGRDLTHFAGQWLEQPGVNTLRAEVEVDPDGRFTSFAVVQGADPRWPTLRRHRLGIGVYALADDVLTLAHRIETDIEGERTEIADLVGVARGDVVLLNDGDLSYAKIRLDEASLAGAIELIDRLPDDLARALIWGACWDMCRDGEMSAADYAELVLRGTPHETDISTVQAVLGNAMTAADHYAPRDQRHELRARITAGLAALLRDAEPGSDQQLAYTRTLVTAIDSPAGIELVQGWLNDEEVPTGLAVDTDLRWRIVHELSRLGAGVELVDAERERDPSVTGEEAALGARAANPSPDLKAWAWEHATATLDLSNESHHKVCLSFWKFDQDEVLRPYVDAYLDVVDRVANGTDEWAGASQQYRQNVVNLLFPRPFADQEFLTGLDAWMAVRELPTPVYRTLIERRDDAIRALRAQGSWQD
ncbi:aminopeptidase N [Propionicicella superfundia]|uniref:aminopeptidase N n=1 Tax=Propionicicella superfundia TaxID=348582 RepID=UPI000409F3CA|nr:aminopeptidase N [Propionicicella superfundia]